MFPGKPGTGSGYGPHLGQDFRLFQHSLRRLLLLVRRVPVLAQDAAA